MANEKKKISEEIGKIVEETQIELISEEFLSYNKKLKFRCKECEKVWKNSLKNIKDRIREGKPGMLCPCCHPNEPGAPRLVSKSKYIEKYKNLAKNRGGELLSEKYIDSKHKLQWKCNRCGYIWWAKPYNIKKGTWCPKCAIERKRQSLFIYDINDMKKLAKEKLNGGECLSDKYLGILKPLKWKCGRCGHEWCQTPNAIKKGTLCPKCSKTRKGSYHLSSIEEMQKLAASKPGGGKCLSDVYINMHTPLKWRCGSCGYEWEAVPQNIKVGTWCPQCAEGLTEKIYRRFFEALFHVEFNKYSPKWLIGSGGGQMHFDGYNKRLKLAFECQGIQHYEFTKFFHKTKKDFEIDKENDEIKLRIAEEHGIIIIYTHWIIKVGKLYKLKIEEIEDYIRKECKRYGIEVPEKSRIDWREFDLQQPDKIKEMENIAESRGGECLSENYINTSTKLIWRCGICGYIWKATPDTIKARKWCPKCASKRTADKLKLTIVEMRKIAKERGGYCLSKKYINSHTKLTWKCGICGNIWEATPTQIKGSKNRKGTWCPNYRTHAKILKEDKQNLLKITQDNKVLIINLSDYNGERYFLELECQQCSYGKKEKWILTKARILSVDWKGCPKCHVS